MHTAALVSRYGGVDWACLPRFSSPSIFALLLDRTRGGSLSIAPARPVAGRQSYLPSTAILETAFPLGPRRGLRVLDFFPVGERPQQEGIPRLVRIVEAVGGPVRIRISCAPRPNYGREKVRWEEGLDGLWLGTSPSATLFYRDRGARRGAHGDLATDLTLTPAESFSVEIGWGSPPESDIPHSELLKRTEEFWLGWVHRPDTPIHQLAGQWHRWVERSEVTLKLLSHADTGAFVAAPTTSLPEWPGGSRNWDYRYAWVRDAAFTAEVLLLLGHTPEAVQFLRWVVGRIDVRDRGGPLRVVYGGHGERDLTERTLRHLAGFAGSRPVRIGNGASDQFQLDIYGELLDAAYLLSFVEAEAVERLWPRLAALAEEVLERWHEPDRGIWESRGPPAHYVYSKLMAWVALERSVRLARRFGSAGPVSRWQNAAGQVRAEILERGFDPRRRTFVQAFGRPELDAAALRLPLVGFLPFTDPRVVGTIDAIDRTLAQGPFVYRYRAPDGIRGPEGAFLPCGFWMVECLARAGRRAEALHRFEGLLAAGSPLGLFSEEYDPRRRLALGNFPQALSHIGLLRAALSLGLAEMEPPSRPAVPAEGLLQLHWALGPGTPLEGADGLG